uniref:Uncharacterized protein n=1 Tax=Glossina palpalis gambiensis TaxID=67801 RepID=A0A1B0BCB7_9MUSC
MDAIEVDSESPGSSKGLRNTKTEQGFSVLFQLTTRGKFWLECKLLEANGVTIEGKDALPEYVTCCRCKARRTRKQTQQKRKPKSRCEKQSPKPKVQSKGALRRQLIREKRAARKRNAKD